MEAAALIVSVVVALGSFVGWLDGRRRIRNLSRRTAVKFQIEREPQIETAYLLRNVGDAVAGGPAIDGNSVKGWALDWQTTAMALAPNQSFRFRLSPDDTGSLPDTIRVTWSTPFRGDQMVVMPRDVPPAPQEATYS